MKLLKKAGFITVLISLVLVGCGGSSKKVYNEQDDDGDEYVARNHSDEMVSADEENVSHDDDMDRLSARYAGYSSLELLDLGRKYYYGRGVDQDYSEAYDYFMVAADRGNDEAEFLIGHMLNNGLGVMQDFDEAAEWYRKAAEKGNDRAQHALGYMYEVGNGVPKDKSEARRWYQRAADQGNDDSAARLRRL